MAQVDFFDGSHDMRPESRRFAYEACGESFGTVVEDRTAPQLSGRSRRGTANAAVTRGMFNFERNKALVARKHEDAYTSSPTPLQTH